MCNSMARCALLWDLGAFVVSLLHLRLYILSALYLIVTKLGLGLQRVGTVIRVLFAGSSSFRQSVTTEFTFLENSTRFLETKDSLSEYKMCRFLQFFCNCCKRRISCSIESRLLCQNDRECIGSVIDISQLLTCEACKFCCWDKPGPCVWYNLPTSAFFAKIVPRQWKNKPVLQGEKIYFFATFLTTVIYC